jgi:hypothetical protein
MKTIVLELPEDVALEPPEAKMILAARMYERGGLSSGQPLNSQVFPNVRSLSHWASMAFLYSAIVLMTSSP